MATFLTNSKQLTSELKRLCTTYKHYMWATAWAGDANEFESGKLLRDNIERVEKLVVGLHFYQTSPKFIKDFMGHKTVRFFMQTDGTFHPKVYLFYNNNHKWEALVGSSNFTLQGFNVNTEANVLLSEQDGDILFTQIKDFVENIWKDSKAYDEDLLDIYVANHNVQKHNIDKLKQSKLTEKITNFDLMSWQEFEERITQCESLDERIHLLDVAHKLFKSHKHFNDIPLDKRQCLAGIVADMEGNNIDWRLFGTTKGFGFFKQAVNNSNPYLAQAIDCIPLEGEINESHFNNYIKLFRKALPASRNKDPRCSATRLLAIKRPDVFVCVDEKNKRGICKEYHIPFSHLTLDNYWSLLIERIRSDQWFSEKSKSKYYKYRVALLDCPHYNS